MDNEQLTRLAVRACRIAFREIHGQNYAAYQEEVARRIQEVWEEEGVDLSSLATFDCEAYDADNVMRRYYRQKNNLPRELRCEYCGAYVEASKALSGSGNSESQRYCQVTCQREAAASQERKLARHAKTS